MISKTSEYIQSALPAQPRVAVVLGSGLSEFSENLTGVVRIPYSNIPGYPEPSVAGHVGELAFGMVGQTPVLCARGRFHYYEGHPLETVTLPIQVFHELGCSAVIITNAAGCLRREWSLGELMVINGHIDFTFRNGCGDPEICRGNAYHDEKLLSIAKDTAVESKITLRQGVYCWTPGPTYETAAEIREIDRLGGDAVGMSTVPEIQRAGQLGLQALGISCLTNYAAGILDQPLNHAEVLETTERVKKSFADLLLGILTRIP